MNDPTKMQEQICLAYLKDFSTFGINDQMPKEGGIKYVILIGPTASGKSTILNRTFNLNLKVGVSGTTA